MHIALTVIVASGLVFGAGVQTWGDGMNIYIAPGGNDEAAGTQEAPFATLERARDAIRELKAADGLPPGGVTVWLQGGRYELPGTLELEQQDSGPSEAPIVYRAVPGREVVLSGGTRIPPQAFGPVQSHAVLGRLPAEARDHVVQADLKALGIEEYGSPDRGGLEVFFGERRCTLARWPNEGFTRIADVLNIKPRDVRGTKGDAVGIFVYEGDRPLRWIGERDLWVHGYWFWDWADQRHRVKRIDRDAHTIEVEEPYHRYGYRKGQWYYAFNALSELDMPGEWYVDRDAGILYLWPPGDLHEEPVTVSVQDELVRATDVSHVTFQGLIFEAARKTAVIIDGGSNDSLIGCTFRDIGGFAARTSGTGHRIAHCDARYLGEGGFTISGGDRRSLTPGDNVVENCHIHDFGEIKRMYVPGVAISGVGNRVRHNLIHTAPHQAISFSGNEHLIEFNEIHSVCYESNDAGAIYAGRDWTMRGTIIRNNYLHHINGREGRGCVGVYLDDMWCGTIITGNIFYRVIRAAFIGGGRDNEVTNNIFVECPRAIHIDARALGWAAPSVPTTMTTRLNAVPFRQPPWSEKYPQLLTLLDDEPAAPKGNVIARNVVVGPYPWRDIQGTAAPYQDLEEPLVIEDPGVFDPQTLTLRLPDGVTLPEGFEPIATEQIGLYAHEDRPQWPVYHEVKESVLRYWEQVQEASLRPRPRVDRGPRPEFTVPLSSGNITVDGRLGRDEWSGLKRTDAMTIREGIHGETTEPPSFAWLYHDGAHLLVAIDNRVDGSKPLRPGDTWGSDDAVEIAVRRPDRQIIVLRGYPSGHFESSNEAGASAAVVEQAAQGVEYAAAIVSKNQWTCEWRIPLASLGIAADPALKLDFNISVRKSAQPLWQMWRGTGAHTWDISQAGILRFAR